MHCEVRVTNALEKVFPDEAPKAADHSLSALLDDIVSFQIACHKPDVGNQWVRVAVRSSLAPWITVREVKLSPSAYPCHVRRDDNYLRTAPGMYPDRLAPLADGGGFQLVGGQWRALWVDVETAAGTPAGVHPVTIAGIGPEGATVFEASVAVEVLPCALERRHIPHTEWFHADCIADYYGLSTEAEDFIDRVKPFVQTAVRRGINTILTPMFTPPLDTAEGGERTTMQLVKVRSEKGVYSFDFARLHRWMDMCDACGVEYFELSHLFTQWGAKYAPKVMGTDEQGYRALFGWHTPGTGAEYTAFLDSFLPALRRELEARGVGARCFVHISDEPHGEHLPQYQQAKAIVKRHLSGYKFIDALSDYEFYSTGAVDVPIAANDHIEPFLAGNVPELWTYYCTSQCVDVSNRFFSMPSARNRILGVQLYLYNIQGFLQWGYNFYNSQYSRAHINPYAVTDAGDAFPSGDAFMVYPGPDGKPEESIRLMVIDQAFRDLRALKQLEALAGREAVEALIQQDADAPITFARYPREASYLLGLRQRVNQEIVKRS